ncbi:hydrolase, had superfamily, cof family [Companilactobacillus tucceti DSM 20183]|uniref:Hydrolase, had superfamily, cof family n=1 Tax=Companilactobacillus tucceti DSM 20183 TaxID=1423811 RepID=A0A0R1J9I4_9LACO|nr:Cof-type HAD-IIB family hydrolase [Companilactobacillus tucceti]KRK65481.1 hydrolase, had superfamily, cof family [Companilactobacillus tucceti DSM 20183]
MIKLFATDMDGTFLRDDMTYDEGKFAEIHKKITSQNIKWVVASGNQYFQLKSFFKKYPDTIYVAENGAYIRDLEKVYALHSFDNTSTNKIIDKLSKIPQLQILVCGAKNAYTLNSEPRDYIKNVKNYYHELSIVDNFKEIDDQILKFALTCPPSETENLVNLLKSELSGIAEPTSSGHGDIDIIQPGRNKAAGLAELGKKLNISLDEMCAFGDGGNDLEMLREVGLGVAMENAQDRVKKVSDKQTSDNQSQGVLNFISEFI